MGDLSESEVRLGELARHDYWVQVKCIGCKHFGTLDANMIGRIYGTRKRLCECSFTCTACNGTQVTLKVLPGHLVRKRKAVGK